jgi:hypothetical protein
MGGPFEASEEDTKTPTSMMEIGAGAATKRIIEAQ